MKRKKQVLWLCTALALLILVMGMHFSAIAAPPVGNRAALIAEVCRHVKVMKFDTDRPVHDVRLLVDGKEVKSDMFNSTRQGIKMAVVVSPRTESEVYVWFEIDNMGGFMKGAYREIREANVVETESFGSGTNLVLAGWTTVYELRQSYIGATNALYEMKMEIK